MAELVVRLIFSLAVVLGLLLLLAKLGMRRNRGRAGSPVRVLHRQALSRTSAVTVVTVGSRLLVLGVTEQQVRILTELEAGELEDLGELGDLDTDVDLTPVARLVSATAPGRAATGAVFSETLNAELSQRTETDPLTPAGPRRGRHAADRTRRPARGRSVPTAGVARGPLNGSVLSPQTWRLAVQAVSGRAS